MHKKYITNQAFRNLVMPMRVSGVEPGRATSFRLSNIPKEEERKKKCC